ETCAEASTQAVKAAIDQQVEQAITNRIQSFREQYKGCAEPSNIKDRLTITYSTGHHHYTLYYYDRAGNLMRTVPPKGVALLNVSNSGSLNTARNTYPAHTLVTEYQYNSLSQLVREHSPDANPVTTARPASTSAESVLNSTDYYATYIYNDKGQLRFSRNAKQKASDTYAYTKYDALGRITEVGEAGGYDETTLYNNRNLNSTFPSGNISQVTVTVYTSAYSTTSLPTGYSQRYLRNRVSYALNDEDGDLQTLSDQTTTVYSYDPHGNVEWLLQMIPGLPPVAMKYEYDLISGKVTKVSYNPGQADQFYHKYDYDANNRITGVSTSRDGYLWEKEADYEYYLHGPLKRTVLGQDKLQGMDYTYTIHGWLKAINHPLLDKANDPLKDGDAGSVTGRDAFGMALTYFSGDYKRSGSPLDASTISTLMPLAGRDLYNGNIATWTLRNHYPGSINTQYANANIQHKTNLTGYVFQYDELNRLTRADTRIFNGSTYGNGNDYHNNQSYDANGNILTQVNYAGGNTVMDNFTYTYKPGTNLLTQVTDIAAASPGFSQDVEPGQEADNYKYDAIGNLIADKQQQTTISWTPYGKVKRVSKAGSGYTEFSYDASGNRVSKKRINAAGLSITNYYVRDASGNIMGVYEKIDQGTGAAPELTLTELPIYGSDRIGEYSKPVSVTATPVVTPEAGEARLAVSTMKNAYESVSYLLNPGVALRLGAGFSYTAPESGTAPFTVRVSETGGTILPPDGLYTRTLNSRQYELKDHLGNVRTVIGDVKLSVITAGVPGAYEAKVTSIQNYYPFGMDQPNRTWNANGKYR
ncbi:hypothetical protein, partial [Chryseosolibacter indicus]